MNEFSKYGKNVDKIVDSHMQIIIEEIKKKIFDVISILVIGGLGRGEGSFFIKNKNIIPLNDYDIYVITKNPVDFNVLKNISIEATKRIYTKGKFSFAQSSSLMEFYVDLRNITFGQLKKVEPMIKYYEIRESAKIIYGKDVRKDMPQFSLEDIPNEDGLRFLINRMSLLIECFDIERLTFDRKKTILYYIGKNYLTCAESLLLLNKKFVASYEKRSKILEKDYKKDFAELAKRIPDLPKKIKLFTNNKLKPSTEFFKKNVIKYWFEARKDMFEVTRFYIEKSFNLSSSNPKELSENIKKLDKFFLKNYLKLFLKSKFKINLNDIFLIPLSWVGKFYFNYLYYKRDYVLNKKRNIKILFSTKDINLRIYSLCPLVLFSINENLSLDEKKFNSAKKEMGELIDLKKVYIWKDLSKKYADIFRIYQFLKS